MIIDILFFLIGLFLILIAGELFTNGIEAIGERLNLSQNFTGSVLAAVGTALPETILPIIAVIFFSHNSGEEIGIGAILGAPFMLSTLAFPLIGITVILASLFKRRKLILNVEVTGFRRDIVFFLFAYSISLFIVPFENHLLRIFTAIFLLSLYGLYIYLTLKGESEEMEEVEHLYFSPKNPDPSTWLIWFQIIISLIMMVGGAHLFVQGIERISFALGFPAMLFSLLVAPIATELPEKINSIIWTLKGKDTLAIGNVSGAMVFQSTIPVSFGIVFTSWDLTEIAFISGIFAIVASFFVLTLSFINKKLIPVGLSFGIMFYILYILLVIKEVKV